MTLEVNNVKGNHRTMNSTHGPFYKANNLPPLSALNKFENSTKASEFSGKATKRAGTNMEVRNDDFALDTKSVSVTIEDQMKVKTAREGFKNDPFYSQEMVTLADEAKEALENINTNKIKTLAPPEDAEVENPINKFER